LAIKARDISGAPDCDQLLALPANTLSLQKVDSRDKHSSLSLNKVSDGKKFYAIANWCQHFSTFFITDSKAE
jgi:hypothetical protein